MTPEGKVKAAIKKVLDSYGTNVYSFMPIQFGYGVATIDYLLCVDGLFVGIEAKAKGKRPTTRQEGVLEDIRNAGGTVFVINSEEDVRTLNTFLSQVIQSHTRVA